ncbi:hypothetical protein SAMN04488564_11032 [Lentzea waywayandensis]|uniref:Uncharacterized protein n=1 Tax=Lentzea waywayandensis TaxID=84724 RepID=A0A1I6F9K4_9PSEU|nr:DUF6345 domain-containing protein [Lentzea waywayandensis]SFR26542.1 hypothetical protein SAMN04488564_11032 [Lentzea waywayandensis]
MQRKLTVVLALSSLVTAGAVGVATADATELPVYGVKSSGLDQEQTQKLQRAFGLKDVQRSEAGAVSFADEQRYQYLPTVDKGQGRPDEDGNDTTQTALDTEAIKRIKTIPTEDAAKRAQEGLRAAGVLPANATPSAQYTTFELSDANGRNALTANLDTSVSYTFQLDGLPLEGEGANIRVSFDAQGVTAVSHAARTYDKAGTVQVNDLAYGAKLCQKYLGASVKPEVSYVYVAPPLEEKVDKIEPSFRCAGRNDDGGAPQAITLPAAVGAELPQPGPGQEPRPDAQFKSQAVGTQVGSEGTGNCSGLPNTVANIGTFNTEASNHGIARDFTWLNANAWESDFKDPMFAGGDDTNWADDVDLTYWQGHGSGTGFYFTGCSNHTDNKLANTDARWGQNDVEWMSLFTCLILEDSTGGQTWAQRWGQSFRGLHQINSFTTISYNSANHGGKFGHYMWRSPFLWWNNPMKVRDAWAQASIDTQPASVRWATMGPVTSSGGLGNFNDFFWGKGTGVGPDYASTGLFWRISGAS